MEKYIRINLSNTSCYLVNIDCGFLLIDCGNTWDKNTFLKKLSQLNIHYKDIHYLFLTHHHADHCGLIHLLISLNPEIRIILSAKCASYLKTGKNSLSEFELFTNKRLKIFFSIYKFFGGKVTQNIHPYFIRPRDMVIENEYTNLREFHTDIDATVMLTPGHTEDSLSFIQGETAFVGDVARNFLNFLGAKYLPILIHNKEMCYDSWIKLSDRGVKKIYPSHGKSFDISYLMKGVFYGK